MAQVMEGQSLAATLQTRSKACEIESGRMAHTRPSIRRGSPSSTPKAAVESGTRRGVPFLVSGTESTLDALDAIEWAS